MATSRLLSREEARRFYDRFGARQDSQAFYEGPAVSRLIAQLDLARARAIVEFGCGTGRLAVELLDRHLAADAHYVGLDASGTMVELARARTARFGGRVEIHHTDGSAHIAAADGTFDRFVSTYVLDLLSPDDIAAVLAEAHRVLAPGALLGLVGLTPGPAGLAAAVTWLLERVHRLRPALVGGCRPLELRALLPARQWTVRHHEVVIPYGLASEILVAART